MKGYFQKPLFKISYASLNTYIKCIFLLCILLRHSFIIVRANLKDKSYSISLINLHLHVLSPPFYNTVFGLKSRAF